jgi:AcrR family transcriptional regulator
MPPRASATTDSRKGDRPRNLVRLSFTGPKAARTREILVAAAKAQFLEHGYEDTTVERIADAANVSRPTFYTYFRSKREALDAVALATSEATELVVNALGELPSAWTTDDIAEWVRAYLACQRRHGPWALVWRQAARVDRVVIESGRANRRYHARKIGKQLRGLGGHTESDPVYDGLMVLAILDSLLADGHRVGGSDAVIVDVAARAIEALVRRG